MMYKIDFIYMILDYFKALGYPVEYNDRVVNSTDSSLLFVNSGIANNYQRVKSAEKPFVTIQKCVRIAGKHNDIDNIGETPIHASCFHMLGLFTNENNEYKLEDAIKTIYRFLADFCKIENLTATIHPNYPENIYRLLDELEVEKTITSDNIWRMNDTVSGICLEFFKDDIEIFNIVYIFEKTRGIRIMNDIDIESYESKITEDDRYKTHIVNIVDSGAGVERLYYIMYNSRDIFDFKEYSSVCLQSRKIFMRVVDLIGTIDCLIQNDIPYGNSRQSYILKKLVRMLLLICINENIILQVSEFSFAVNIEDIVEMVEFESSMLKKSMLSFTNYVSKHRLTHLSKKDVIYIHSTLGVVYELLDYIISKTVDITYDQIDVERDLIQSSSKPYKYISYEYITENIAEVNLTTLENTHINETMIEEQDYIKYEDRDIRKGRRYYLSIEKNIFYPHNLGGQTSDKGFITINGTTVFTVDRCMKIKDPAIKEHLQGVHPYDNNISDITYTLECTAVVDITYEKLTFAKVVANVVKRIAYGRENTIRDSVVQNIDIEYRQRVARNHTAHHIILITLKNIIKGRVVQASSTVTAERSQITVFTSADRSLDIETVNRSLKSYLSENHEVSRKEMNFQQVYDNNITYLHTAYYPEKVTVVKIDSKNKDWISEEVCAGFHVENTDEIKSIIVEEISIINPFLTKYYFKAS